MDDNVDSLESSIILKTLDDNWEYWYLPERENYKHKQHSVRTEVCLI